MLIRRGLSVFFLIIQRDIYIHLIKDEGENINDKLTVIKTNKIIDYSNSIATSSNVISIFNTGKYDKMDLAGLAVITRRLFNDINFLYDVKYEFINEGLKKTL